LSTRARSFAFAGVEAFGWDPLRETQQLLNDVISLIQLALTDLVRRRLRLRPRLTDAARLRLALLLYSHLTEVDAVAVYETLANLVKITTGKALHDGPVRRPLQTAGSRPVRTAPAICQATQNFVQFGDPTRRDLGDAPPQNRAAPRGVESKTTEAPKRKWIGFNEPMDGVADLIEFLRHVPTLVAF